MKTLFITAFLFLGGIANTFAQKLVLTFTSTSSDFPVTIKYAEKDSTNMNVLMKIDMNKK